MKRKDSNMAALRQAMRSHNARQDYCMNDAWNLEHKRGTVLMREVCGRIASFAHRDSKHPIDYATAIQWAKAMLPIGAGYPWQDTHPRLVPIVEELRAPVVK